MRDLLSCPSLTMFLPSNYLPVPAEGNDRRHDRAAVARGSDGSCVARRDGRSLTKGLLVSQRGKW